MTSAGKKVFSLAIAALLGTAACGLWGIGQNTSAVFASEVEQVTPKESTTDSESGIMPASVCKPDTPKVLGYEVYNCFVAFPIQNVDNHTRHMYLGKYNGTLSKYKYSNVASEEVRRYVVLPNYEEGMCVPDYYLVGAECVECGNRSEYESTLSNTTAYREQKPSKGVTVSKTSGTIPTATNQSGTVWTHGGKDRIYFSIACNGEAFGTIDDEDSILNIPNIWLNTKTVTVGGVTFTVQAGPNKVSIKADTVIECNAYETMFAFYVV